MPARGPAAAVAAFEVDRRTVARCQDANSRAGRWTLLSLWAETRRRPHGHHRRRLQANCHSQACPASDGIFPSIGHLHPPPFGWNAQSKISSGSSRRIALIPVPGSITAAGRSQHPLAKSRAGSHGDDALRFLPAEGPNLHQIPVGPVHAGIIEPGHFRFTASGETVVRLEERLRLCAQGHRAPHGWQHDRACRPSRRPRVW